MAAAARALAVVVIGMWMIGTAMPGLMRVWNGESGNGLVTDYDGWVTDVAPRSAASAAGIVEGDRVVAPFPPGFLREPPETLTLRLAHGDATRTVTLRPSVYSLSGTQRVRELMLYASYAMFLFVGSAVLLLRPSAMTWAFYLYCVLRRYGDLGFYWPGSTPFFWANTLLLATLGGASCALVLMFALRFPTNVLAGWRRWANAAAVVIAVVFPLAWFAFFVRVSFLGLPSQSFVDLLVRLTSVVYLAGAAVFTWTFLRSRGDERQRLRWIVVFPTVLVLRVVAINLPYTLPDWFAEGLVVLAVSVPLAVAYAVVRRKVFDIEFVISRALVYGSITSVIGGTFLLVDWFMSKQFAETRFTLTAEIIVALALGSWLNILHRNVDRFVDSTFFRQRHLAEQRLARASAAVLRADSREAVDRFLVHEPVEALELTSAALFRQRAAGGEFTRELAIGDEVQPHALNADDPLVLHLLAEGAPVRLADVRWSADYVANQLGGAVLAAPVLLRDQLAAVVLYGAHKTGADIDPDEVRSLMPLVERAGAAYDHIEARALRAQVDALTRERDAREKEVKELLRSAGRRKHSAAG
jgi:hypothetical protein